MKKHDAKILEALVANLGIIVAMRIIVIMASIFPSLADFNIYQNYWPLIVTWLIVSFYFFHKVKFTYDEQG